jgi:hypothetical protein
VNIDLNTDGPHSPEYTREVGNALAEAVRVLNHATGSHAAEALEFPSDVDAVVQSLTEAAQRLPQLIEQLTQWLTEQRDAGRITVAYGPYAGKVDEAMTQVEPWLDGAQEAAAALASELDGARQNTATFAAAGD